MNEKNEQVTKTGLMCQMLNTQIRRLENSLNLSTVAGN